MTQRAGLCAPACGCWMRARSIIASRLPPEFLPTNPLRCCNLFLLPGGDAQTVRKFKSFNTEGTEVTETDSERLDSGAISFADRRIFRILLKAKALAVLARFAPSLSSSLLGVRGGRRSARPRGSIPARS